MIGEGTAFELSLGPDGSSSYLKAAWAVGLEEGWPLLMQNLKEEGSK